MMNTRNKNAINLSGFIIEYISHPVINSFTTASAITIAEAQFKVGTHTFSTHSDNLTYIASFIDNFNANVKLLRKPTFSCFRRVSG